MKLFITNATVCDPQSAWNGKVCDLVLQNGVIEKIISSAKKSQAPAGFKTLDVKGQWVLPGLFDLRCYSTEPGFEYKDDISSLAATALAGGYTALALLPDTQPAVQTKAAIHFLLSKAEQLPVQLFPYGALTHQLEGKEMNELFDLFQAGAIGFTDADKSVMNAGVLLRAMQYASIFGGKIFIHAEDIHLSSGGRMHEGYTSVNLGLKGIPNMSEEIMVMRNIELAKYAGTPLHFSHISSKGSVELIRKAKKQGLSITCDVAVAHLIYTDEQLQSFDTNYKLNPPLRTRADQKALWEGIVDGTINCIVSDHKPEDAEHKVLEFEYAATGMIMLQTAFALLLAHKPSSVLVNHLITCLCHQPREILNMESISLTEGKKAELTVFNPKEKWMLNEQTNLSKSKNSTCWNQTIQGRFSYTINKNKLYKL